jgi:hypothetical protein
LMLGEQNQAARGYSLTNYVKQSIKSITLK